MTLENTTRSCQSAHATATFSTATRRLCSFKMQFQCLCFGEIPLNFDLKNMISTYTKDFSWKKKDPKSPNFQEKIWKSPDYFYGKFQ
jgi:hypothetical protein